MEFFSPKHYTEILYLFNKGNVQFFQYNNMTLPVHLHLDRLTFLYYFSYSSAYTTPLIQGRATNFW